jgi:type III pantothenate kinase
MKLLIDVGNSRLKWALLDGQGLTPGAAIPHGGDAAARIAQIPAGAVEAVWIAQVMGAEAEREMHRAVQRHCGVEPRFARAEGQRRGLINAYAEPQRLGVDRWLAMLAVWTLYRSAFVVVNAGTALTIDVVDDAGRHLGGLIAPGLHTAEKALLGATRFPTRQVEPVFSAGLGNDTESCVRQGALLACLGAVDRAAAQMPVTDAVRILTGGDAASLSPGLGTAWQLRPQLVLEGLAILAA